MKRTWHYILLAVAVALTGAVINSILTKEKTSDAMLYRDDVREIYLYRGKLAVKSYDDGGTYLDASMKNIYRNEIWVDVMEYSTWHIDPVNMRYKVSEITSCNLDGETLET